MDPVRQQEELGLVIVDLLDFGLDHDLDLGCKMVAENSDHRHDRFVVHDHGYRFHLCLHSFVARKN